VVLAVVAVACGGSGGTETTSSAGADTTGAPATTAGETATTTGETATTAGEVATTGADTTAAAAMTPATLRLDWSWLVYHVPFLYALEEGYYAEEGIELEIEEGEGSGTTVDLIANGNDTFGFADSSTMMAKASQGATVKNAMIIQRQSGFGTACWPDVGFTGPQDLVGHSVILIPQESTATIFPAYLELNDVNPDDVSVVNADFTNKITLFANHEADCMAGYVGQDTLLAQMLSPEIEDPIPWTENGIQLMGHGIVVNDETIANDPEMVEGFVRASIRGWEEVCADPQIGIDLFLETFPDLSENDKEFSEQSLPVECGAKLDPGPGDNGTRLGPTEDGQWQAMLDLLTEYADLQNPLPPADYYTNDFVASS
jgi:NitT/TauT family transport system substrate-binding protein